MEGEGEKRRRKLGVRYCVMYNEVSWIKTKGKGVEVVQHVQ